MGFWEPLAAPRVYLGRLSKILPGLWSELLVGKDRLVHGKPEHTAAMAILSSLWPTQAQAQGIGASGDTACGQGRR